MYCQMCGGVLPDDAKACPACGAAVPESIEFQAEKVEPAATPVEPSAAPAQPVEAAVAVEPSTPIVTPAEAAPAAVEPAAEVVPAATEPAAVAVPAPAAAPMQPAPSAAPEGQVAGGANAGNPNVTSQNAWAASASQNPYASAPQNPYGAPPAAPNPYASAGQAPYAPQQTVYAEGCISAALADLRASEGWVKRSILLGLVSCVPILNFTATGYTLNWAREVPYGGRTPLPKGIVTGKNFELGFYAFVLSLVFSLGLGVVSVLLAFIPLLGWLASVALSLAVSMFLVLLQVRLGMSQQLGEGFNVSKAWGAMKRNWTSLFCAAVVPELIVGFVGGTVLTIVMMIGMGVAIVPVAAVGASGSAAIGGAAVAGLAAMGFIGVVLFIACIVVFVIFVAIAQLITFRAVAHWVGRYAPEWTAEFRLMV